MKKSYKSHLFVLLILFLISLYQQKLYGQADTITTTCSDDEHVSKTNGFIGISGVGNPPSTIQSCPTCPDNLSFEDGNFNNWTGKYGTYEFILPTPVANPNYVYNLNGTGTPSPRFVITSGTATDPNTNNQVTVVAPCGGSYSARVGSNGAPESQGAGNWPYSEALTYSFTVTPQNAGFTYQYAAVLKDGNHDQYTQPKFEVIMTECSTGNVIPCGQYSIYAGNGSAQFSQGPSNWQYTQWTPVATDLTGYMGQQICVTFRVRDCMGNLSSSNGSYTAASGGGHAGYAYVDAYCTPVVIQTPEFCAGSGSIQICAPAGYLSYSWPSGQPGLSGSPTTQCVTINNPVAGNTYTVNMSSVTGCPTSATIKLNNIPVAITAPASICAGTSANISVAVTNNTNPPYSYSWNTGATTSSITVSPNSTTTYTVTVTNGSGCTSTETVGVTVNSCGITASATTANACQGGCATITASGANGSAPYSYSWNTGATTASISPCPSATTTYTVTVTDNSGATATATTTVTVNPLPTISVPSASLCSGGSTTLTASGANTYAWSPATGLSATTGTTVTANPSSTTTYTVTGTSTDGCTGSTTVTVTVGALAVNVTPDTICAGGSTTLSASGGTSYSWSPPTGLSSTTTANPVASPSTTTTYTVTATSGSCTGSTSVTVTVETPPTVSVPNTSICPGGSALLTASGANTYNWSPGTGLSATSGTTVTANPSGTTTYTVTGTTAGGCTGSTTVTVTVGAITADAGSDVSICPGSTTTLNASGGSTYSWSPSTGLSSTTIANPVATPSTTTIYTVTASSGSCSGTDEVVVTVDPAITLNMANTPPSCSGSTDGQASVTATGGSGTYSYLWTPGSAITTSISGPAGSYSVTVTDQAGCTTSLSTTITDPTSLTGTTSAITANCGQADGSATVATISGGTGNYTYSWNSNPVQTTQTATNLLSGSYTVTISDGNSCTITLAASVPNTGSMTAGIANSSNVSCNGGNDGSATVAITGGTTPFIYNWSPSGGTAATANGLTAGNYTVITTDAVGCSATTSVTITQPSPIIITAENKSICPGTSTSLSVTGSGGAGSINYTWNPGALSGSTITVNPAITTIYTITGTDINGCTNTAIATVTVLPAPTIGASNITICEGSNGTLTVNGAVSYTWAPSATLSSNTGNSVIANPLVTTNYTITGTSASGCTGSSTVTVTVNPAPIITVNPAGICPGDDTVLTANGASSYTWTPTSTLNNSTGAAVIASPLTTTIYTITGTGANGCTSSIVTTVTVNPKPIATFTSTPNPASEFNPTISFSDNTSGAINWEWNLGDPANTSSSLQNLTFTYPDTAGEYQIQLIVSNQFGCIDTAYSTIIIKGEFTFFVPNTFTPNGDGINDGFTPQGAGIDETDYHLFIFDRWGNLIWQTKEWGNPWNGKANNGSEIAQEDTYVWKVRVREKDNGTIHNYIGHVNIVK